MVSTTVPEDGDKDGAISPATGPEGLMPPRQEPKDLPPRPPLQPLGFPRLRYISTARLFIFLFWRLRVMCKHCSIYGGSREMDCKSYHQASPHRVERATCASGCLQYTQRGFCATSLPPRHRHPRHGVFITIAPGGISTACGTATSTPAIVFSST